MVAPLVVVVVVVAAAHANDDDGEVSERKLCAPTRVFLLLLHLLGGCSES